MKVNFIEGENAEQVKQAAQIQLGKIILSKLSRGDRK